MGYSDIQGHNTFLYTQFLILDLRSLVNSHGAEFGLILRKSREAKSSTTVKENLSLSKQHLNEYWNTVER